MDALISPQEAEARIMAGLRVMPAVKVSYQQAHGRILREPLLADRASPPIDRAMMDGIACRSEDFEKGRRFCHRNARSWRCATGRFAEGRLLGNNDRRKFSR